MTPKLKEEMNPRAVGDKRKAPFVRRHGLHGASEPDIIGVKGILKSPVGRLGPMAPTLGQLIRERRMELNLTQEELAERVGEGVRQSEISRLEKNRVSLPRRQRMEQIAEALDIPVGVLLSRSGWAGAETLDTELADLGVAEFERDETRDENPGRMDLASQEPGPDHGVAGNPAYQRPAHGAGVSSDDPSILPAEEYLLEDDEEYHHAGAWTEEDSQSLRDTVSRTESLIEQSRTRIQDAESTMVRGRRSFERSSETGPR